ncbi:MAG: sulfotransferase [Candidatus Omnitrophica bacterium]|nr:sulfotransferase [Candidatus Omnitrophota bacterium]
MFPDFLVIGAMKSGTSWLRRNLKQHPDIWMPPLKELHYFNRAEFYQPICRSVRGRFLARFIGTDRLSKALRKLLIQRIKGNIGWFSWESMLWDFRYFFGKYDDEWCASLFEFGKGKVTGEASPTYANLKPEEIKRISKIMPKVKIIYILRNPINRTWSNLKHLAREARRRVNTYSQGELVGMIEKGSVKIVSEYLQVIDNWQANFSKEQIFIGFFDEIVRDPEGILLRLYKFFGGKRR